MLGYYRLAMEPIPDDIMAIATVLRHEANLKLEREVPIDTPSVLTLDEFERLFEYYENTGVQLGDAADGIWAGNLFEN